MVRGLGFGVRSLRTESGLFAVTRTSVPAASSSEMDLAAREEACARCSSCLRPRPYLLPRGCWPIDQLYHGMFFTEIVQFFPNVGICT